MATTDVSPDPGPPPRRRRPVRRPRRAAADSPSTRAACGRTASTSPSLIVVLFTVLTGGDLLKPQNLSNIIVQNSYVLILAIGMILIIIAGHIDLSVGSVLAATGAVAAV